MRPTVLRGWLAASMVFCLAACSVPPAQTRGATSEPPSAVAAPRLAASSAVAPVAKRRRPQPDSDSKPADFSADPGPVADTGLATDAEPLPDKKYQFTADDAVELERGSASWYGPRFHGRLTASGERYDKYALTAAHKTLPFGTIVRVRSLTLGREVDVRINDRGPFAAGRIIDVSEAAAEALGLTASGVAEVSLNVAESLLLDAAPLVSIRKKSRHGPIRSKRRGATKRR